MKSNYILNNWEEILLPLVPNAELRGDELVPKNPRRNDEHPGSFRLNIQTGVWADFALDDVKGRSPVSYIAYVRGCSRHQARHWATKRLHDIRLKGSRVANKVMRENHNENAAEAILPVPPETESPPLPDRYGYPVKEWTYRNKVGEPLFIVRRYSVYKTSIILAGRRQLFWPVDRDGSLSVLLVCGPPFN